MFERDVEDSIRRHPSSLAPPERHRRFGPWGIFAAILSAVVVVGGVLLAFVARGGDGGGNPATVGAQVVVVAFERPRCRDCLRSEAALEVTWRRYRSFGVAVMGIRRDVVPVVASHGSTPGPWPVLADPHGDTARAYGVRDDAETFVIDGNGKVVAALDGPVTAAALAAQLAAVLGIPATTRPAETEDAATPTPTGDAATPEATEDATTPSTT
jgi:peroxiredoxin